MPAVSICGGAYCSWRAECDPEESVFVRWTDLFVGILFSVCFFLHQGLFLL